VLGVGGGWFALAHAAPAGAMEPGSGEIAAVAAGPPVVAVLVVALAVAALVVAIRARRRSVDDRGRGVDGRLLDPPVEPKAEGWSEVLDAELGLPALAARVHPRVTVSGPMGNAEADLSSGLSASGSLRGADLSAEGGRNLSAEPLRTGDHPLTLAFPAMGLHPVDGSVEASGCGPLFVTGGTPAPVLAPVELDHRPAGRPAIELDLRAGPLHWSQSAAMSAPMRVDGAEPGSLMLFEGSGRGVPPPVIEGHALVFDSPADQGGRRALNDR
jgi:hypothetical protein